MNCARWGVASTAWRQLRIFSQAGGLQSEGLTRKKTSTCAVLALLRTRNVHGCLTSGFWIPLRASKGGWACKRRTDYWPPRVLVSVRQKCRQVTNTAEVLCRRWAAARLEFTTTVGPTQAPVSPVFS